MIRPLIFAALLGAPVTVFAAGGDSSTPPSTTNTTTTCTGGQVWDAGSSSCVNPQDSRLDPDTLLDAVREFAYAGQYGHAQAALRAMPDQSDDMVLTYWGFTSRKMGDTATGMDYYNRALARNPDNILARSYMGQALVLAGDMDAARLQLGAIRDSGGAGTWAETALAEAITSGSIYNY